MNLVGAKVKVYIKPISVKVIDINFDHQDGDNEFINFNNIKYVIYS